MLTMPIALSKLNLHRTILPPSFSRLELDPLFLQQIGTDAKAEAKRLNVATTCLHNVNDTLAPRIAFHVVLKQNHSFLRLF